MKQQALVKEKKTNFPEIKFRAGSVTATVWVNSGKSENGETQYRTISLDRNYTDKQGNWHSTNSFRANDLPKAQLLLAKAYEHVVLTEQPLSN